MLGDSGSVHAEVMVAPWGAVSADDIDLASRMANGYRQLREDVVEPGIEVVDIAGAMIAKEIVQFR
jgi:hypothetical protein